jgi:hypothetical protein
MSVSRLREERKAGRIKSALNGRIWRFTDEDIAAYEALLAKEMGAA